MIFEQTETSWDERGRIYCLTRQRTLLVGKGVFLLSKKMYSAFMYVSYAKPWKWNNGSNGGERVAATALTF